MPKAEQIIQAYDNMRELQSRTAPLVDLERNVRPTAELYTGQNLPSLSKYDEGISYQEAITPGGFEQHRHEQQPWYASLGNAVNQALVGEIVGGTLEGTGYLLDLPQYIELAKGTEKEFGNWLSDLGKDLRTWTQETTPIYTDPTKEGQFSPEDWTWWMSNAPSIASTLSLMIPAAGAVRGASLIGKGLGLTAKLGKTATWAATGLGQAIASRHMENLMEASGTAEELRQMEGTPLTEDQYRDFQKNYGIVLPAENINGQDYYVLDSNSANEMAAKAASNIYKANWAMLAQDIPQYLLLNTPFGKATEKLTASMAKKLGQSSAPIIAKKTAALLGDALGEGGEEAYQYTVAERAKELALVDAGLMDRRNLSEALSEYTKQGEFWTSAFFGAIGAGVMQTAGKPLNKMINRVKGIESEEERRMKDLDAWKDRINNYSNTLLVAEQLNSPDIYEDIKSRMTSDMAVQAAENGNLDYMIQTLEAIGQAKEQDQAILGITPEAVEAAKKYNPQLIKDIKRVGELYDNNVKKYSKPFIGLITSDEKYIESLNDRIGQLRNSSERLYSEIPNIDKLSNTGSTILKLQTELDNYKNINDQLEKLRASKKDPDIKDSLSARIAKITSKIQETSEALKNAKESYTAEDKKTDKAVETKSTSQDEYGNALLNLQIKEEQVSAAKTDLDELRTYKGQEKYLAKQKRIQEEAIQQAAQEAETAAELNTVANAVNGTEFEKTATGAINDRAATEDANDKAAADFFSAQVEQAAAAAEVENLNEEAVREQIKESVERLKSRYIKEDGSINNATLFKDINAIENILAENPNLSAQSVLFKNIVKTNQNNPEAGLLKFLERIMVQANHYHNDAAVELIGAIGEYFNKSANSQKQLNTTAELARKTAEVQSSTTDNNPTTKVNERPISIDNPKFSRNKKGTLWISTSNHDASVMTSHRTMSGKWITSLNSREFDREFLFGLNVPIGGTLHIEINEFDEGYNPNEKSKFNADTRRYRIVYYIDGNSSNRKSSNRKVIGLLPISNSKSTDVEGNKAIKLLREKLFKQFPPQLDKPNNQKSNGISTGFTTKASGTLTTYAQVGNTEKDYINPSDVVAPVVTDMIKSQKLSKDQVDTIESYGGFYLGYINSENTVIFKNTNIPNIKLGEHNADSSEVAGEMVVAIPNPAMPSDILILRAFKKKLGALKAIDPAFVEDRIQEALDIIKTDLEAQDSHKGLGAIGLSASALNKLKIELAFPHDIARYLLKSVTLKDVVETNSDGHKKLLTNLNNAWINFKGDDLNSRNYTTVFGSTIKTGPYNSLMSRFLGMNMKPGELFSNVQVLMETNFTTVSEERKVAKVKKEVAKEVKAVKSKLQPEVVKEAVVETTTTPQVEVEKVSNRGVTTAKKTPFKTDFDTGMVSSKNAIMSDLSKKPNVDLAGGSEDLGIKFKLEKLNASKKSKASAEELNWLKNKLPHVEVNNLELIMPLVREVVKGGYEAVGAMYNAAVYVNDNPTIGTLYHEAFHVLFNYALSESERAALTKDISGKDIVEKEEYIADQFTDFLVADYADKTIKGRLRKFFRQLKALIKALVGADVSSVRELADRADLGFYRKSIRTSKFEDTTLRTKIDTWSFERNKEAVDSISKHIMMEVIPAQRKANPELADKTDAEILRFFTTPDNPFKLFRQVYIDFANVYNDILKENENDPRLDLLYDLITNLIDSETDAPGKLVFETIKSLGYNSGIYINIDNITDTVSEQAQEDELVGFAPDTYKENWQIEFHQRSAKDNAPQRIKNFIRYMRTEETNSFGLPKYVEYDDTYDGLLKNLAGSKSINDIIEYLNDNLLFHPEYQQLIDAMGEKSFATDMLQAFSRDLYSYTSIVTIGGNYTVIDSNRRGLVNTIVSAWTSGVIESDIVTVDDSGNTSVDVERAKQLKESFDKLVSVVTKFDVKDIDSSVYQELSDITKEFGFEISPKVFEYIQNGYAKQRQEFYNGTLSLSKIINRFAEGANPFNIETVESVDDIKSELSSIKAIAQYVKKAHPDMFESSFIDGNGNRVYAHNIPTYLSSFVNKVTHSNKFDEYLESRLLDDFFNDGNNSPSNYILKKLNNAKDTSQGLNEALKVSFVDTLSEAGNKVSYADMTYADLQAFSLAAYFNNGNKKYSNYRMPVFSDAGRMAIVRVERPTSVNNKVAIAELVQLAEKEYNRILLLQKNGGNGINSYDSDVNKSLKTGFHIMSMLNGKVTKSPVKDIKNISKLINDYFDTISETYYNNLINNKVLVLKDGKFDVKNSRIDARILSNKSIPQFKEFIKEFLINDFLVRSSMSLLTIGDPAFYAYKGGSVTVDYTKRAKEIMSPKLIPDVTAEYVEKDSNGNVVEVIKVSADYKTIYLEDNDIGSPNNEVIYGAIQDLLDNGVITESKAKELRVAYSSEEGTIAQTDGQAYTTLPFYRQTMISYNRWSDRHQSAYKRLEKGLGTANDITLMMQPIKPFMFSQIYNDKLKRFVPVQHKNSEYVLLPQLVNKHPKLKKLYDFMTTNDVGVANFNTAVKVGGFGSVSLDTLGTKKDIMETISTTDNFEGTIIEYVEHIGTKEDGREIGARNINKGDKIQVVLNVMRDKFDNKTWTNPATSEPLVEDAFNTFEEFLTFALLHEKAHEYILREEGESIKSYETRVNNEALRRLESEFKNNVVIHNIPTIDRGIQQETPEHVVDSENLFGTQIRKLIMSDLFEGTTYFDGMSSQELYRMYEDLIVADLKEAYEAVESRFLDEDGNVNYQKLHDILLDEARKRSKGDEFEKAIELVLDKNGVERTQLPLFHPLFSNTTESLITSVFRNNVTKQKINGAAVVQVSNFGLSRELKLVFEKEVVEVKEGVNNIFEKNPELSNIGTQEQYSKYLETIFPDSKVKDIVYHGSKNTTEVKKRFDEFNVKESWGHSLFFTKDYLQAYNYALYEDMGVYAVVLNIKNPRYIINDVQSGNIKNYDGTIQDYTKEFYQNLSEEGKDFAIEEITVDNPEQTHILGSKQDIEGFKEFVKNQPKKNISGLQYAEIMLPAWSKQFFTDFVDEDGNVNFEHAKAKLPEEIFEMIGYRIPTEDKYSMMPLKVVGFLPIESGGSIMLPAEITTISGSDFDIDKMYLMMKSFKRITRVNYNQLVDLLKDKGVGSNFKEIKELYDSLKADKELTKRQLEIYDVINLKITDNELEAVTDVEYIVNKYDKSKEPSENSKAARDNMKIDLMMSVLRNAHTLEAILTPGGYEYNRKVADAVMAKSGVKASLSGLFDIITQDEMAIRNMTGKKLVGIAANHNAHHALRQHYNLRLASPVLFDEVEFSAFGQIKALKQFEVVGGKVKDVTVDRNISRNLSEFLAAVVDNAKDPLAAFMNYNTYTADVISMLVSLGVDTHTAVFFMNQPIVLEVIKTQIENPKKYISTIINTVAKKYGVNLKQATPMLYTEKLYNGIGSKSIDALQKQVLVALSHYQKNAKDLGDVIRASTSDTKGLGASIAHGETILNGADKILNNESTFTIEGVEELFMEFADNSKFVNKFNEYGVKLPIQNILNKVYPYNNPVFKQIKTILDEELVIRNLSADERNYINRTIVSYLLSGFEFFNTVDRGDVLNKLPKQLLELRKKYGKEFANALTSRLNFENASEKLPLNVISFNNVGKLSDGQRVRIQQTWADMLDPAKTANTEVREFAENLVRYAYYTSGLNFTPNSFGHLIPVDAYISLIKDSNGLTVSDILYQEIDAYIGDKVTSETAELINTFIDQFYRNNYNKPSYVPRIEDGNYSSKTETMITINIEEVSDDSLYYKTRKAYKGRKFIVEKVDNEYKLYKFDAVSSNNKKLIFNRVTTLGVPNYIVEYNKNGGEFMESVIPKYVAPISKPVNKPQMVEAEDTDAYLQSLAATVPAEKRKKGKVSKKSDAYWESLVDSMPLDLSGANAKDVVREVLSEYDVPSNDDIEEMKKICPKDGISTGDIL